MALSPHGSLAEAPLPLVLGALVQSRATGILILQRGKVKRSLGLDRGRLVSLGSNALSDSLGHLLEAGGRLEKGGSLALRKAALEAKLSQGAYLLSRGEVTGEELERYHLLQARVRLASALTTTEGGYVFQSQAAVARDETVSRLSLPREARQVLGRRGEGAHLRALLEGAPLSPEPGGAYALGEAGLSQEESGWLITLDGRRPLGALLADAPADEEDSVALLISLKLSGLVFGGRDLEDVQEVTSPLPDQRSAMAPPPPAAAMAPPAPAMATPAPAMATPAPVVTKAPPPPAPAPQTQDAAPPSAGGAAPAVVPGSVGAPGGVGMDLIESLIAEEVGELEEGAVPMREEESPAEERERLRRAAKVDPLDFETDEMKDDDRALAEEFKKTWIQIKDADYFRVLGLEEKDADPDNVRRIYFRLAKSYYADRLVNRPQEIQELGREIFHRVHEAYEVLSDPEKKAHWLESGGAKSRAAAEDAAAAKVQAVLTADALWRKGVSLLNAGSIRGANVAFKKAIDHYPEELEYKICLAFTEFLLSHPGNVTVWQEAERTIHDAVKVNEKLDRGFYFLGRIQYAKERPDRAKRYYAKAITLNPRNVDARKAYQAIKLEEQKQEEGVFASLRALFKR